MRTTNRNDEGRLVDEDHLPGLHPALDRQQLEIGSAKVVVVAIQVGHAVELGRRHDRPGDPDALAGRDHGAVAEAPLIGPHEVDDTAEATQVLEAAGAKVLGAPRKTPFNSVNARLETADGLQLTLFELDHEQPETWVGGSGAPEAG